MAMVRGRVLAPVLSAKPDVIPNTVTHCSTGGPQQQVVTGPLLTPSQIAFTGPVRLGVRLCQNNILDTQFQMNFRPTNTCTHTHKNKQKKDFRCIHLIAITFVALLQPLRTEPRS